MFCHRFDPKRDAFTLSMNGEAIVVIKPHRYKDGRMGMLIAAPQEIRIGVTDHDEAEREIQILKAKEARDGTENRD